MKQQLAGRVLAASVVAWLALAAPVLAGGEPRMLAPPSPGEEVVVPVTPGAWFELSHSDFDPDWAVYLAEGEDLVVLLGDGRVLVLAGLFAAHEPPATISLRGAPPRTGAELEVLAWMAPEEEAMAPFGAPLGLVAFAGWLLDRSPFTGTARADEMPEAAAADEMLDAAMAEDPLLARLSMQIEIAHAALVVEEAARWHTRVEAIAREKVARAAPGVQLQDELRLAEATVAHAEIEETRARLAYELAVDRHEDAWGVQLEGASWPRWADSPPRALEALYAALDEERFAEARGHWRRMTTAADLAPTHELHVAGLDKVAEAWREQFDHAQRSVAELLFVERLSFDARVMELDTRRQRAEAEARLLALLGRLSEADLQHPTTE